MLRTLKYVVGRRPWALEAPLVVQFPVNDICDSKCQMCNIWQQKLGEQITVEQARRLFSDPLFGSVVSLGMNGGEPTLRRDLPQLADALFDVLPRLRSISLITNGLHAERVIERVEALAERVTARGGLLDVMVSLDGVGVVHDRIRGATGNFEQAVRVLDRLHARKDLQVRVGCTIIRDNAYGLHELLDFCVARGVYVKFRLGVPHGRLYNLTPPPPKTIGKRTWLHTRPFDLDEEQRWHVGQFLLGVAAANEPSLQQRFFYQSLADQILHGAPRRAGCDWQHRGVTVTSRGELMYCAVQSAPLGDARTASASVMYYGRRDELERILAEKCASCAHDYVGPPGGRQQAMLLLDEALARAGLPRERLRRTRLYSGAVRAMRWLDHRAFARRRRVVGADGGLPMRPQTPGGPRPILLCGWYGTETLGDKAILGALVSVIRALEGAAPILIASLEPQLTRLTVRELPELAGCSVVGVDEALVQVAGARALVFAGGPLMAVGPLADMEALFRRARGAGVPAIVAGCGVGPLGPRPYKESIAALLSSASARIYRDEESRQAAASLGIAADGDAVAEDPALGWALRRAAQPRARRRAGPAPVLALALRDWPHLQYAPELGFRQAEEIRCAFELALVRALDRLTQETEGLRIVPIPFCTHALGGDDRLLYWRLARATPRLKQAMDLATIGRDLGPLRYLQLLGEADACLAMRFHSIVLSLALSTPVVALDYTLGDGKSAALARRHGLQALSVKGLDADSLVRRLQAALRGEAPPPLPETRFDSAFAAVWKAHVHAERHS